MSIQTVNPKTGIDVLPDINKPKKRNFPITFEENLLPNGQLRCQCGFRLRLSDDDRSALKEAYRAAAKAEQPANTQTPANTYISVATAYNTPILNSALGMDSPLFSQVVNGRDPLALGLILRFEKVLKVKLVRKAYLKKVFDSYIAHLEKA